MNPSGAPVDLERIVPEILSQDDPTDRDVLRLHQERYRFAAGFTKGKQVLDLACGVGYGTAILKQEGAAASVHGVDIAAAAIEHARNRYQGPGIVFSQADGESFHPASPFDVVVSLETIEHVRHAHAFVARLASFVRPGGLLIGSVPITLSTDVNPYHLHDFTAGEFRALYDSLGLDIEAEHVQVQPFSPFDVLRLRRKSGRRYDLRPGLARYYARHPRVLAHRILDTLTNGFCNKYLVLVGRKPS